MGFVTKRGGGNSHAALIARAKGVPYISSIDIDEIKKHSGSKVIIDGKTGKLIINPNKEVCEKYEHLILLSRKTPLDHIKKYPPKVKTKDGIEVAVWANIDNLHDLTHLFSSNIEGIGLLRSEFLYLKKEIEKFSEEEQTTLYQRMFRKIGDLPFYFRVFDIGGDKHFSEQQIAELNPALGCRSIRFLLRNPTIFITQLRSLFRAGAKKSIQLLLPLVADLQELMEAKQLIFDVVKQLENEKEEIPEKISIGCMIELPSAVLLSDLLAEEADFFSIGTNDLIQYTLAADRNNPDIYDMYQPAHLSILRMIQMVLKNGNEKNIPISICGEMASNPLFIALLIGLGIRHLSCPPIYIPMIKKHISFLSLAECTALAQQALSFKNINDINNLLVDFYCHKEKEI